MVSLDTLTVETPRGDGSNECCIPLLDCGSDIAKDIQSEVQARLFILQIPTENKATARLATRSNSWIFHDASFTKSWYLQGFVKT